MARFVRASKYRHVFGHLGKKEYSIDNVKVTGSAWDTNMIAASGSYLSINWNSSGGGAFAILPLASPFAPLPHHLPSKLPDVIPLARGHTAPVLDTVWNPFDDSVVASGGEDGKVLIWKVEESQFDAWGGDKWVPVDFDPVARVDASPRKIGQVLFHPTAAHVLASASGEHTVKLWDLNNTDNPKSTLVGHGDTIQSLAFNTTGNLLVTTCRDRKLRLFDPRTGGVPVRVGEGHGGIKGARVTWMGERDKIATTGFSRMSERQVGIWETGSLANERTLNVDQSAGVVMPFWSDNNILFLAGKGDGNIRYYEYEGDQLYALDEHKSSDPQRGLCFLPRRALNVSECEIARAYKVAGNTIEPIAFVVPRRADSFQSDIFPPAPSSEPALSAREFFEGKVAPPNLVNLENGTITTSTSPLPSIPLPSIPPSTRTLSTPLPEPAQVPIPPTPMTKRTETFPLPSPSPAQPSPSLHSFTPVPSPLPASVPDLKPTATQPEPVPAQKVEVDTKLQEENAKLNAELREARAMIRTLELQVEAMRANAQRAAKALLEQH
ncbi:microtubule binding protein [Sistotremastrum suecicum HHB10207 ss-3]|uniref:Coronin n=1 Tax=Sistotremastrum suecicum HHB10207 ss-3 TaxID=1314776 RepID=A0A166DX97_9AGAM|nr:microtubule binding protein [Sistotremastrum suecicum HHB10207 ss-3]